MRASTATDFGSVAVRVPPALRGQRIGLLGGSFNPPHAAHRMISQIALRRLGLDAVWWIVSPGNPLKSRRHEASLPERVAWAKAMAADARIRVTDFEAGLPTPFTASTLAFLRRRRPGVAFVWLMGADNLASVHRWRNWRGIFRMMPIAVIDRPGWRLKALASPAGRTFAAAHLPEERAPTLPTAKAPAWTFLTGPLSDLSSTALRIKGRTQP
jgi:nicotinate-nucleotide adenylyltransferase